LIIQTLSSGNAKFYYNPYPKKKFNILRACCTVYGYNTITLNQLITDFITGQIRPIKLGIAFIGDGTTGPK